MWLIMMLPRGPTYKSITVLRNLPHDTAQRFALHDPASSLTFSPIIYITYMMLIFQPSVTISL